MYTLPTRPTRVIIRSHRKRYAWSDVECTATMAGAHWIVVELDNGNGVFDGKVFAVPAHNIAHIEFVKGD
jgi:hypothetical protein